MTVAATNLTGWWVGCAIGAAIVVVVAVLVLTIIVTARRIAAVAEDATRSLVLARDRTEVLWEVNTTNTVASDILAGAKQARAALGGGDDDGAEDHAHPDTVPTDARKGLGGVASSPPAPGISPERGA